MANETPACQCVFGLEPSELMGVRNNIQMDQIIRASFKKQPLDLRLVTFAV